MSNLRTAAQQALEALEDVDGPITALLGALLGSPDADSPGAKVRAAITALKAALAEPGSDYERGFVDGMLEQARRSVDKAVNAMAEPIIKPEIKEDNSVPQAQQLLYNAWADEQIQKEKK